MIMTSYIQIILSSANKNVRPNVSGNVAQQYGSKSCLVYHYNPLIFSHQEYVAYSHTGRIIPAIWFRYDLSPITVKYTERRQPLYRFITTICAIIGGTFTVAGIIDSCIFTASEAWKKIQLGKLS